MQPFDPRALDVDLLLECGKLARELGFVAVEDFLGGPLCDLVELVNQFWPTSTGGTRDREAGRTA